MSLLTKVLGGMVVIGVMTIPYAHAVVFADASVSFSKQEPMEGDGVRLYAHLENVREDTKGIAKFFDDNRQISPDQPFSVLRGKTDDVYTDYAAVPYGERAITVRFLPWREGEPLSVTAELFADRDSDEDGRPDRKDEDDDNDKTRDAWDAFPFNPNETTDTDADKTGDNADPDDDDDAVLDENEKIAGTDPKNPDTDDDGTKDGEDAFPLDPKEHTDVDRDGLGDNADPNTGNKGPIAEITLPSRATVLWPYRFTAERSHDPDGTLSSVTWTMDGHVIEKIGFWYFFAMPGTHEAVVELRDDENEQRVVRKRINVSGVPYLLLAIGSTTALAYARRKRNTNHTGGG